MKIAMPTVEKEKEGILCYCINCPDSDEEISSCLLKPNAQCFFAAEEQFNYESQEWESIYSAGCLPPDEQSLFQCKGDLVPSVIRRTIKCCSFTDYCNKDLMTLYKPHSSTPKSYPLYDVYVASIVIVINLIVLLVYFLFMCLKRQKANSETRGVSEIVISNSDSGVEQPLLERNTIGKQVIREIQLGKGRFSEKWVVKWRGEKLVMKMFSSLEEKQWLREMSVYFTGLGHENVVSLIGADTLCDGTRAVFTEYFLNGSLRDYIKKKCLNNEELITLSGSAIRGIAALHMEIRGSFFRPAIVHLNITSNNFLINQNRECVISDFDVALINNDTFNSKMYINGGEPRYSAPEVIDKTINVHSFESFKMADMYSFGLVLWEMCRRCNPVSEDYALPFYNVLEEHPTKEDMQNVFINKIAIHEILGIPHTWNNEKNLNIFASLIKECVLYKTTARPTVLRMSKCLAKLENQ